MRSLLTALVVFLACAPAASAAPRWLGPELPFGEAPALPDRASAAMAPDGTVLVARFAPDGALEVRERPPGGPFGATTTLPRVAAELQEFPNLQVLVGEDGTAAILFDVGGVRFASLRTPGGEWSNPREAAPGGTLAAAVARDGALWILSRSPEDPARLATYRLTGALERAVTLLPAAGARQLAGALSVARDGAAHVAYFELAGLTLGDDRCLVRSKVRVVDVPAGGDAGHALTLDQSDAGGTGTAERCVPDSGESLQAPLLLATGADGSATAVWTRLVRAGFTTRTLTRHREPGAPWVAAGPPEEIGDDAIGERLLGGPGDPLVVVRSQFGRSLATRGPDGAWTAPTPLLGFESFDAARTGTGTVAFAWVGGADIVGRVFDPATGLGERTRIAAAAALLAVRADDEGNAVALSSDRTLRTYGYDAAGPRFTSFALPGAPVAGASALFSAEGVDVWSGPARDATWDFGDGAVEDGLTRPHAYASGGRRTVAVRLRDVVGNATTRSAALDVADAPAPPGPVVVPTTPPRDTRAPRLTHVSLTPRRPHSARPGLLQLTIDEAGRAKVELAKQARGVRRGKRCVAAARPRGRTCTRTLARRTVSKALAVGAQRISLPRLGAGTWRVRVVVTDAAGNASRAQVLTVRVH